MERIRTVLILLLLVDLFSAEEFITFNPPGEHNARIKVPPKDDDGDNHKPIFTDCFLYAPSIKEEQEKGLHVITVKAIDNDPPDNGGTITYSIVKREGDRNYFKIDNVTGAITTNLVSDFDRDEPTRMKEIYITVQAIDNGRPVLADICTFKVTIEDINDNAPTFDKHMYDEKVSEDAKIGGEVMRVVAYDIDDGPNAKLTYSMRDDGKDYKHYFSIDEHTGVIYLISSLERKGGSAFSFYVVVHDNPVNTAEQKENSVNVRIEVIGSDKKPPLFLQPLPEKKLIKENYNNYNDPIASLTCTSNIEEPAVQFELSKGLTTQTNKDSTFILEQVGNTANIKLGRALDYETVNEYQLTVRCTNKDSLTVSVQIDIEVEDVNDEIPTFIELVSGSVRENEHPNAEVMQVRAIDRDGTSANNIVSYELEDHKDLFAIDPQTGKVTTLVEFDREKKSVYNVKIIAKDNSKSALTLKDYNSATQTFRITIEDRNDNPPHFTKKIYTAERIPENSDIGKDVIEIKANDDDTASLIQYKIIDGNIGNAFAIENTTGRIKVNSKLDFETIENYNLTIEANDGIYQDKCHVLIEILNVNDEQPRFEDYDKNINIYEEEIPAGCIITLNAYDPDIKDRNADQHIVYRVKESERQFLHVNNSGCVTLIKELDRDKPNGYPFYQAYIIAYDDNDSPTSKQKEAELFIVLKDINDNAPFLNITQVVWYENQNPGKIATLTADDYDSGENGPPFTFQIAGDSEDIKSKFSIDGDILNAVESFDRETKKFYDIPIEITDSGSPTMKGTSILRVIIGDENDNEAKPGNSSIFVYNYKGQYADINIGRVYVDDPDDWDLNDKVFAWDSENANFHLDTTNGSIIMRGGVPAGVYTLKFLVTEEHLPLINYHQVEAIVSVTVQEIPEEAVQKSGSVRLSGTTIEEFVEEVNGAPSKKYVLQKYMAKLLNTSMENVDVLTVLTSPSNNSFIDVRFSAHGSPYYPAEKLNNKISQNVFDLENQLGVKFEMISINECMMENTCLDSCINVLEIDEKVPAVVFTNKTSFVGVSAVVEKVCSCTPVTAIGCFNGGTVLEDSICDCPVGYEGPRCEILSIGFTGTGWAMYKPFDSCKTSDISLEITTTEENGLIFYLGPMDSYPMPLVSDFISLEIRKGYPYLLLSYGSGVTEVELRNKKLNDGNTHTITISLQKNEIVLSVDNCHQSNCQVLKAPRNQNFLLNVNGPLQVGGTSKDIKQISNILNWEYTPTSKGFMGCVRNLTFNDFTYNLGEPGEQYLANPNCNYGVARAVSFGIDSNFLVTVLVCLALFVILLLAVVVHRRKQDHWGEKDTDDIRENIISYEDEGGGEVDTAFDLGVLRRVNDSDYQMKGKAPEVPDISGFLTHKKDSCDKDANSYPFDDVRHYAYEGDGNSTGSLSSLASCTDDGDLNFNHLSSFGPRFRKLADMYGEEPSDEESQEGGEESWC